MPKLLDQFPDQHLSPAAGPLTRRGDPVIMPTTDAADDAGDDAAAVALRQARGNGDAHAEREGHEEDDHGREGVLTEARGEPRQRRTDGGSFVVGFAISSCPQRSKFARYAFGWGCCEEWWLAITQSRPCLR